MTTFEIDGAEIEYRELGSGEPLLLLHGFSGTGDDWMHVFDLERLAERYRVILPDLRGHGGSTNPAGELRQRRIALDMLELCAHLGVEQFRGVGMSLGSNVLLHLATLEPERVSAIVLVAPWMYFSVEAQKVIRAMQVENPTAADWQSMRERHTRGDDQIRALWRQAAELATSFDDTSFSPPKLATIRARTLLVNGDRDPFLPPRMLLDMHESISGSALWVIPEGDHGPIYGDWRERFESVALSFLGRRVEARS
jgi:pimeloyl-ACP methyl ester carboxylesterase